MNATLRIPFTFSWCNCARQAVTLEHVPRAIAFDVSSAPHQVAVLGFQGAPGGRAAGDGAPLLNAAYDLSKSPVQTFQVRGAPGSFDHIRLQVTPFSQECGYVRNADMWVSLPAKLNENMYVSRLLDAAELVPRPLKKVKCFM